MQSLKKIIFIASLLLNSVLFAQTTPPIPNPPPPGEPIDGFLIVLFLLAIGYGVVKKNSKKLKTQKD